MKYALPLILLAGPALADAPVVEEVTYSGGRFSVTLSHGDTGWDDYADGWRVELADGTVLGTRVLAHPHVEEQPFTRSSSITVPADVTHVFIRASDSVGGWASDTTRVSIR
ncbi:hypothetical protein [Pseudooctadecabacter sp.]|uniref:hypothetical protein n=1 Tax=Pseudooctadecabacter sp. TaxID=1966338 RepID=UPI0025F7F2E5|nr:hypothetical protein [Pseudooctadecabacter sp.]